MGDRRQDRVVAIGLDSAEYRLVKQWIDAGHLPEIAALFQDGAHGTVKGAKGYTAETPWTTFLSGCWPSTTGYWSPAKYHNDYSVEAVEAYRYDAFGHFYDYCHGRKVIAFDVPHARVSDKVEGIQILAWGAHSPQGPTESFPATALAEVVAKHGRHPVLRQDDILVWETEARAHTLEADLIEGIKRRTAAAIDLMATKPWDLFLVVYGEPHSAGHGFWHLSQPEHPLYQAYQGGDHDPLLAVYKAMDEAVGHLRRAMPADARLVVFSQEGMKMNSADLPSWLFLPELLYRMSFPGEAAFARTDPAAPLPPLAKLPEEDWMRTLWASRESKQPLARVVTKHLGLRASRLVERLLEPGMPVRNPVDCKTYPYMPQLWYQPAWPRMKAFALPSFSEGNIRINVRGREQNGIVAPEDFGAVCQEVIDAVSALRDPRTGNPLIREILPQRDTPFARTNGPDADIIILWHPLPTDVADSPRYGRIGPAPFRRTGDHYDMGFFVVAGPGIRRKEIAPGDLVDLAPTLLDLMGVAAPNHFDGRSRVAELT